MRPIRLLVKVILLAAVVFLAGCNGLKKTGQPPLIGGNRPTLEASPPGSTASSLVTSSILTGTPAPSSSPDGNALPTVAPSPTSSPVPCDPTAGTCIESGHFLLDRPIALPGTVAVDPTYTYGTTQGGNRPPHHGVEFYNASGTPVLAAADGRVIVAGDDSQTDYGLALNSYGNLIVLEHDFPGIAQPVFTVYAHLSTVEVQIGQPVHRGDEIGKVGATGAAIGSHLHFEVRLGANNYDSDRNPVLWLKPLTGEDGHPFGVIAGRLMDAGGNPLYTQDLNIQFFPDPSGPQEAAYPVETYASEAHPVRGDDMWKENFTLDNLPAGNYRISLIWNGTLYDRWIVVLPGKVTLVTFVIP